MLSGSLVHLIDGQNMQNINIFLDDVRLTCE